MTKNPKVNETKDFTDEEIAHRRDDVIRRMANTPPKPHKPLGKSKPKDGARPKQRGRPKKHGAET